MKSAMELKKALEGCQLYCMEYTPHIRRIGEKLDENQPPRHPARRWVVERTLAWLSKCRAILIRCEKKAQNDLALLKLACGLIWYRRYRQLCILR